jgi:hypothetical protein
MAAMGSKVKIISSPSAGKSSHSILQSDPSRFYLFVLPDGTQTLRTQVT